jgi:glutamate-1-semialdehyde 2,1-aminomutase
MSKGQNLWKKAKTIIPNGNMLLTKKSELFLPNYWPSYFTKAKGCEVWDLDKKKYYDVSTMGVGCNTLGYGNEFVDNAVLNTISNGNMSTLNCPEEVELAEKLISMHPWAQMVKFSRSGGEANSIAVRIARAASKKDNIAICGYHGWHDWYLSSNLERKDNLDDHLLPNLEIAGVPKALSSTVFPFKYNDIDALNSIVKKNNIGTIKMEVSRSIPPKDGFLENIRELCNKKNIILIFDECTSGFRETFGGLHKKYEIKPDIAMFSKALGNGYAISAVIGKKEIMKYAEQTFISSTYWTERIGPTAGIATINEMEKNESWVKISDIGCKVSEGWTNLAKKYDLDIDISGLSSIKFLKFNDNNNLIYKTFITQEMLKQGFLASNAFYASIAHKENIIKQYLDVLDDIFNKINESKNLKDPLSILDGPVCETNFKRMN